MKFLVFSLLLVSCIHQNKTYTDDFTSLPAVKANSPEHFILVDDKPCLDVGRMPGLCSARIAADNNLSFRLLPRPYNYDLSVECSKSIEQSFKVSVLSEQSFRYEIPHENFEGVKSFICIGEIFPKDRKSAVSSKFEFRVKVVDKNFIEREKITFFKESGQLYVSTGETALYTDVMEDNTWTRYEKSTKIKVKSKKIIVISESYLSNFNYYFGI